METSLQRVEFQGERGATTLDGDLLSVVQERGGGGVGGAHGCLAASSGRFIRLVGSRDDGPR